MKKTILFISLVTLLGCTSSYPPRTSTAISAAETNPAPAFLIEVPAPIVIYQAAPAPTPVVAATAAETNTAPEVSPAERNPYTGSYIIPAKPAVASTTVHEAAGAVAGVTITNTVTNNVTQPQQVGGAAYPVVGTTAPATNASGTSVNTTNANSSPVPR